MTRLWRIKENPVFTVEQTMAAWVLWGPCDKLAEHKSFPDDPDECPRCGGTGEKIIDACGFADSTGKPTDPDMIHRNTGIVSWTPEPIHTPF